MKLKKKDYSRKCLITKSVHRLNLFEISTPSLVPEEATAENTIIKTN